MGSGGELMIALSGNINISTHYHIFQTEQSLLLKSLHLTQTYSSFFTAYIMPGALFASYFLIV